MAQRTFSETLRLVASIREVSPTPLSVFAHGTSGLSRARPTDYDNSGNVRVLIPYQSKRVSWTAGGAECAPNAPKDLLLILGLESQ